VSVARAIDAGSVHVLGRVYGHGRLLRLGEIGPREEVVDVFVEGAASRGWSGQPASPADGLRATLDVRYDARPAPGLRVVFSDQLDLLRLRYQTPRQHNVNMLREAYVSWQVRPDANLDLGRVNVRHGTAWGYNPTDYFRAGSLRTIVSPSPASIRENRLGTVVLQAQKLWADGAISGAYSPRLESTPSSASASPDFGATNGSHRWLLVASHRLSERFHPEVLLHGGESQPTQLGFNLSGLLGQATVAFFEGSVGDGRSLIGQATAASVAPSWQRRAAAGFTYTTDFNLSLTAEAEFNSAAPNASDWNALPLSGRGALLRTSQSLQDLPVRHGEFFYATWQDALVRHFDLSAFLRHDSVTHSRVQWLEGRYHWNKADLALQWLGYSGNLNSIYALIPVRRTLEASVRMYF